MTACRKKDSGQPPLIEAINPDALDRWTGVAPVEAAAIDVAVINDDAALVGAGVSNRLLIHRRIHRRRAGNGAADVVPHR